MKFMTIVKGKDFSGMPPQELLDGIVALGEEAKQAGAFVSWGGLQPTSAGARARISGGKLTITDGPFTESKEVIGGFTIYDVASLDEAKEWVRRFMELHLEHFPEWEGETEIRPMFEEPPEGS
jgi:hypothetical protein